MPKKPMSLNSALVPLDKSLPTEIAAAIGTIVARHAYLDWLLGQVMYSLMEISIKQGRVIMKLPRPRVYIAAVKELLEFHEIETKYDFEDLAKRLEKADRARRELTRSVYMRDTDSRELRILLARSHWGGVWNREMKHLMLRHAFRFVDAVVFIIGSENIRSQRAVEKLGGIRLPEMRPDSTGQLRLVYQIAPGAMPPAE